MKLKRAILAELGRDELKHLADELELVDVDRRSVDALRDALARSRRATPDLLIESLGETQIKAVCQAVGLDPTGRRRQLVERLLAKEAERLLAKEAEQLLASVAAAPRSVPAKSSAHAGATPEMPRKPQPRGVVVIFRFR